MNFRDVEQLSSYLDGQLSPSDSARLENRLASDPDLVSTLQSLREARGILRSLPHRRAPRNFLLTPRMVGKKPPLPRSYPVFRFATALATVLFALSFVTSQMGRLAASAPVIPYGRGGGGGSDMATEAPAMLEPMLAMPAEAPATEAPVTQPPIDQEALPTQMALVMPTPSPEPDAKEQERTMENQSIPAPASVSGVKAAQPLLGSWQVVFLVIAVLGALGMFLIRRFAVRKWRSK